MSEPTTPPAARRPAPYAPAPSAPAAPQPDAPPAPPAPAAWSGEPGALDGFLDGLRRLGDDDADGCVRWLRAHGLGPRARALFARLAPDPLGTGAGRAPPLAAALAALAHDPEHAPLVEHLRARLALCPACGGVRFPAWMDRAAVLAGQRAFMTRMLPSVLVLLCKSLPEGYAAPSMAEVLNLSGELARRPYHRLMGTLQLLVTVCTPGSFEGPHHAALVAAEQMRLLHAGVRSVVAPAAVDPVRHPVEWRGEGLAGPDYEVWPGYARFTTAGTADPGAGPARVPINLEDMLGTVVGFSLLVVDGLERLGMPFAPDDAAAYYEVWRTFGVLMGIHPPGRPDDTSYVPPTLDAARAFYAAYGRRNYVGPRAVGDGAAARAANPAGYALAGSHVHMLGHLLRVATRSRWIPDRWWARVPRFYVRHLVGEAGYARLGLPADPMHGVLRVALSDAPRLWARLFGRLDPAVHAATSRWLLSALVEEVYGPRVTYPVPMSLDDLRHFVEDARGRAPVS